MMHIIYAVIGIALTVLVTFGGVSYFAADTPIRIVAAKSLDAQYDLLKAAVVSYRNTNNGLYPQNDDQIAGLLPGGKMPDAGAASRGYEWSLRKVDAYAHPVICLTVDTGNTGSRSATQTFVRDLIAHDKVTVTLGEGCGEGAVLADMATMPAGKFTLTVSGY
jgi:hypothetical protein